MTTTQERPTFDQARYDAGKFDGIIETLDKTGDTKIMWDQTNEVEVAAAQAAFDAAKAKGAMVYKAQGEKGERGEQVRTFDKTVERIIIVPQLVGG